MARPKKKPIPRQIMDAAVRAGEYERELRAEGRELTLADKVLLEALSMSEMSVLKIKERLAEIDYSIPEHISQAKALNEQMRTEVVAQMRIHKALKIDRASKVTGKQSELEAYLPKLASRGRQFLSERAILLVCDKCRRSDPPIDIPLGTLIWHFPKRQFRFQAPCPRCRDGMIDINHENYQRYLFDRVETLARSNGNVPKYGPEKVAFPDGEREVDLSDDPEDMADES